MHKEHVSLGGGGVMGAVLYKRFKMFWGRTADNSGGGGGKWVVNVFGGGVGCGENG